MPYSSPTALSFSADAAAGGLWPAAGWAAALEPPIVLIADSDEKVREQVAFQLRAAGYRTLVTGDGRTAMEIAARELPQLVVLDVALPGLDGLGFCYELHSSPQTAHIPVIIISERNEPSQVDLGRIVGAEDHLAKPFTPHELLARVEHLAPRH